MWLGWLVLLLVAALSAQAAGGSAKVSQRDWKAIRTVITSQLMALRADDGERALTFASPEIRKRLGNADAFLAMVKSSYYPLYRPRSTEFLEPAVIEGQTLQPLQVVAEDGTVHVAIYSMVKGADGQWKISGCQMARSTLEST
jgi:Domain of unknown function (DUF4864)